MKNIWLIAVFFMAIFFYYSLYSVLDRDLGRVSYIGFLGYHVFYFFILYAVFNIYVFHLERLLKSKNFSSLVKIVIVVVSLILPVSLVGEKEGIIFSADLNSILLFFVLLFLLYDFNGAIRLNIIKMYEKRVNVDNNDMFIRYPPKTLSDIYIQLFIAGILIIIVWNLNMV